MPNPLENKSTTNQTDEGPNARVDLVPLDLLAPQEWQNAVHEVTERPALENGADTLPSEVASSLQPIRPSPQAQHHQTPVAPLGPRLDRVPTLSVRPAAVATRHCSDSSDFAALTASIKRNGLAQPLFVRILSNDPKLYELFAGHRRWRAALAAKVDYVPVIVFEHLNETVAFELNLLENLNRRDISIIEEAEAFRVLVERYGRTPAQIAALSGRSLNQVTNMLCLVALPEAVRVKLRRGHISFEHGRALIGAADPTALANRIVAERLTVRETELLATQLRSEASTTARTIGGSEGEVEAMDSAQSNLASNTAPPDSDISKDLRILRAALRTTVGAEFDMRIDRDDSDLLIAGRSAHDTAKIVSILRQAMSLLRMNALATETSRTTRPD